MNPTIEYFSDFETLDNYTIDGFFVGWYKQVNNETLKKILLSAPHKMIAVDTSLNKIIGFVYAITDGHLSAYIPLLEVLPEYQKNKIGSQLVDLLIASLSEYYMIDLACDENLISFYEKRRFIKSTAMIQRNYNKLS